MLPSLRQRPQHCAQTAEPAAARHERLTWRGARATTARAGPDSAPDAPSTTSSAGSTSTAEPPPAAPAPGLSKEAILARIARAKKYKGPSDGAGGDAAAAAPEADAMAPAPTPGSAAAAARAAALPQIGPTKIDWGAVVGFLDAPVTTERAGGAPVSYGGTAPVAAPADAAAEAAARAEREQRFMSSPDGKDYMSMLMNSQRSDGTGSAARAADSLAAVLAQPLYDPVYDENGAVINPQLRMEEFTAAKEAKLRAMGGEVITADMSYNPGGNVSVRVSMGAGAGMMAGPEAVAAAAARRVEAEAAKRAAEAEAAEAAEAEAARVAAEARAAAATAAGEAGVATGQEEAEDAYKPKVSTWGMFPRPRDISEAYGGGRDIKPGQELETPQQRSERERNYAAALALYKARAGLEVDPEDEEKAARLYEEGMELFNAGELQASFAKFEKVVATVPVRTKYGGLGTLQKAIVLDSVGQSEAAQKLYKSIVTHGVAQVSKKAKQMLFSFEAMTFLKADKFSYSINTAEYDKYFRGAADRRTLYVATEEDRRRDEEAARVAGLVAMAVILAPVLAVAVLAIK